MNEFKYKQLIQAIANNLGRYRELNSKDTRIWTMQDQEAIMKYEQQIGPASTTWALITIGKLRGHFLNQYLTNFPEGTEERFDAELEEALGIKSVGDKV